MRFKAAVPEAEGLAGRATFEERREIPSVIGWVDARRRRREGGADDLIAGRVARSPAFFPIARAPAFAGITNCITIGFEQIGEDLEFRGEDAVMIACIFELPGISSGEKR